MTVVLCVCVFVLGLLLLSQRRRLNVLNGRVSNTRKKFESVAREEAAQCVLRLLKGEDKRKTQVLNKWFEAKIDYDRLDEYVHSHEFLLEVIDRINVCQLRSPATKEGRDGGT